MSFFGFGQNADIEIVFDDADKRKVAEVKTDEGKKEKLLLYYDGETVSGRVNVTLRKPGSKLEHQGIKVELIGQIELFYDRGNHHEFISLVKELARPGDLLQHTSYPFEFANVEKPYEVYTGSNVRLRYFLRATIVRRLSDIVKEVDIAVHTLCSYPEVLNSIKMEVGIEDCLHIEFEYNKSKYHLKDVIVGKIYFLLVRIKIKHMEISIIKRETTGSGPNTFTENETVAKYEIMDGAPVRGESIPIRVFLAGYDLTPTMRDINNKFSVRYYLNLVLMDTEDRRYFKQQEVTLWRKSDKSRLPLHNPHNMQHLPSTIMPRQLSISSEENSVRTMSPNQDSGPQRSVSPFIPGNDGDKCNGPTTKPIEEDIEEQGKNASDITEKVSKVQINDKPLVAENTIIVEKPPIAEKPILNRPEGDETTQ
ncbi:Vacuolar protein sorting-associated protein 26 [Eumeta japonica]|uniref:Vacuolar protein sorting-associated protein 26 n=1 Tax=Eumeta variegata TaxID=151549 RepID=A0A4C1US01_EUMVA|nr:Vacuolar protein sorting-associated protein 26 [Eumeta japonica]